MEVEISPEPDDRKAVLAAVEALLSTEVEPPPYRSAWREAGVLENVAPDAASLQEE